MDKQGIDTAAHVDALLSRIGRPAWLTDLVIARLDLDTLLTAAYSAGVADGRGQLADEQAYAAEPNPFDGEDEDAELMPVWPDEHSAPWSAVPMDQWARGEE